MNLLLMILGAVTVCSPLVLLFILALAALLKITLSESSIVRFTSSAVTVGLTAAIGVLVWMIISGSRQEQLDVGEWVSLPQANFHFCFKIVFDRLSLPLVILTFVLCGTVGAFTSRYLHRESGFVKFFLLYALFLSGMVISCLAWTIETLFIGWEMVGLSSALLIAFFHEREAPVRNGQRVWSVYRLADAAFVIAALLMHHFTGAGDFGGLAGGAAWPQGNAAISPLHALIIGSLLLIAVSGKSALVPFSGWLPRAMEGPTPSSAIFYGALSVHLGAYLLLRVSPILDGSVTLQLMVIALGLVSAVFASVMARVQCDVKSSLAYASLTQVGIIVVEIGLGFRYLALVHMVGHACLRSLQLLRAPTLLHDYHTLENAIGTHLHTLPSPFEQLVPKRFGTWWYQFGLQRGYTDLLLDAWFVQPFCKLFRGARSLEQRWTNWLSRSPARIPESTPELTEWTERSI